MAKKIGLEIEIKTQSVAQASRSVGGINEELRELKKRLATEEFTPEVFQELTKHAGFLQEKINSVNKSVKNLANDNAKLDAVVNTAQGIAGGFAAAQGAAALFGNQNEDLQKTFVKLQASMSLLNGIQAISNVLRKESALNTVLLGKANIAATASTKGVTTATKGFSKALIATGIGALVVAIGLLIANFDKLKAAVSGVSSEQKNLVKDGEKRLEQSEKERDAISEQENILKLQGKSQKDIIKLKQAALKETIKEAEALLLAQEGIKETQIEASKRNERILRGIMNFLSAPLQLVIDTFNRAAKMLGFDGVDFNVADRITKMIFNPEKVAEEADKTIAEARAKLNQLKNEEAGFQLAINEINKKAADDKKAADEKARQEAEAANLARIKQKNKELDDLQKSVDAEIALEQKRKDEIKKIRDAAAADALKASDDWIDREKKREEAQLKAQESIQQSTIQSLAALSNLFEQGSAEQKAFALASIAADTATAIGRALANSQSMTADNLVTGGLAGVVKFAAISAAILSGAAQARNVLKGGTVAGAPTGSLQTSLNIPKPPQADDPQGIRVQRNQRVFVLESDISRTQRRVNVLEQNSILD